MADWIDPRVGDFLQDAFPQVMRIAEVHGLPCDYAAGERPRHFAGALDTPENVQLLLLMAEPGSTPYEWERGRPVETWLNDVTCDGTGRRGRHPFVYDPDARSDPRYEERFALFPARFLAQVWPECAPEDRMGRTVIANAFWMQAFRSGADVKRAAERDFAPILAGFIDLFPNAVTVAAGGKAQERVRLAERTAIGMQALTLPAYNHRSAAQSRAVTAETLRQRFETLNRQ